MKCVLLLVFQLTVLIAVFNDFSVDAQVYVINTNRNCNSTTNACGRYGSSGLCTRFRNRCVMNLVNQVSSNVYTRVNNNLCRGIAVNSRGRCRSSGTSGTNGAIVISVGK